MQFSIILAFAATAIAAPLLEDRQAALCSGSNQPLCCATDVLNLLDVNCFVPPTTPTSTNDFIDICSAQGQQAKCCLLPVLDQALVCSDVTPTA